MAREVLHLKIRVERAEQVVAYEVQCDNERSVLVGSGSHCDVRLLPEDAAAEQLRLIVHLGGADGTDGVEVNVLSQQRAVAIAGRPVLAERLQPGAELSIGQARVRVELVRGAVKRASGGGSSAATTRLALLLAIVIAGYVAVRKRPVVDPLEQSVEAPALFSAAAVRCPVANGDVSAFQANRLLRTAQLKAERSPFYVRDGVNAVANFEQAAACFDVLGRARERDAAQRAAALLRTALTNDFHARRVRLERFLARHKYEEAQHEVGVLKAFVGSDASDYAQWLSAVQRELTARFAAAEKKG